VEGDEEEEDEEGEGNEEEGNKEEERDDEEEGGDEEVPDELHPAMPAMPAMDTVIAMPAFRTAVAGTVAARRSVLTSPSRPLSRAAPGWPGRPEDWPQACPGWPGLSGRWSHFLGWPTVLPIAAWRLMQVATLPHRSGTAACRS
jgi:hypothetical protein